MKQIKDEYLPRLADVLVEKKLAQTGAVVIKGPKWCGKTMTALKHSKSALFMQDPDTLENNIALASEKPSLLLKGDKPKLIDEWQEAPVLWDAVRFTIDKERLTGAFILTGSATPKERPKHSGAGRMGFVEMKTMTLSESRVSSGAVSLSSLFSGEPQIEEDDSQCDIERLANLIIMGGWPIAVTKNVNDVALDYINAIVNFDIHDCDDVKRNPRTAKEVLQEYSRCVSTQAGIATMSKNLKNKGHEISRPTFIDYIGAYRKLNIIDDLPSWQPSLKSKARTTSTPKRYLTDPSLACASLNLSPGMLIDDLSTMGHFFENMCIRDITAYCSTFGANVYFFHDSSGLEVDCVVVNPQGKWGLIEIKLRSACLEDACHALNKACDKIDKSQIGEPTFKMIITGSGFSRIQNDGIIVCPITCLRE